MKFLALFAIASVAAATSLPATPDCRLTPCRTNAGCCELSPNCLAIGGDVKRCHPFLVKREDCGNKACKSDKDCCEDSPKCFAAGGDIKRCHPYVEKRADCADKACKSDNDCCEDSPKCFAGGGDIKRCHPYVGKLKRNSQMCVPQGGQCERFEDCCRAGMFQCMTYGNDKVKRCRHRQ